MRNRPDDPCERLASPAFLGAITLLLLNDHLLKPVFHNWATGKLSDVVGLYAFAFFWMTFLQRRRVLVGTLIVIAFAWWKSPLSGPALTAWNGAGLFPMGRTVDYTDLLALPVVALAGRPRVVPGRLGFPGTALVMAVSLFAFTATSMRPVTHRYDQPYPFSMTVPELYVRLSRLGLATRDHSPIGILAPEETEIDLPMDECWMTARIRLSRRRAGSLLHLVEIQHRCPGDPEKDDLRRRFESRVVERLRVMP